MFTLQTLHASDLEGGIDAIQNAPKFAVVVDALELLPGMPADLFILTGERTPFAYLVQPIRDSLSKAWREP